MKKKRREIKIPEEPLIYKIEILIDGQWILHCLRVQKKIKHIGGKRKTVSATFETLKEAKKFRDSLKGKTTEELPFFGKQSLSFKFANVFERFLNHKRYEAGLQKTTVQKYEQTGRHLDFFNGFNFDEIDSKAIDAWINFLKDPEYTKLQRNHRINYRHEFDLFRGVVNYFIEFENEDYRNPIRLRHKKRLCSRPRNSGKEIRFLRKDQIYELKSILNSLLLDDPSNDLARLMFVQLETGLRIGEVTALQKNQINFAERTIFIDRHLQWDRAKGGEITLAHGTKGGRNRLVYISQDCMRILKMRIPFEPQARIFSIDDNWILYRRIQHFYKKQLSKVNSPALGSHTLRHTFAVNFLKKTKDIHALQKILGHADLTETQGYAKYSDESTRQAFEKYDDNVLDVDFNNLTHKKAHNHDLEN